MRRLDSLTRLRFVCAALVLLCHVGLVVAPSTPIGRLTDRGYVGVTFFFVLSGFVLTWTWRDVRLRDFYRRRAARIYPLHVLTWGVALLVIPGAYTTLGHVLLGTFLLQGWAPGDWIGVTGNPVAWSLCCEAFFYAVLPFLAPRLMRASPSAVLATAAAAAWWQTMLPNVLAGIDPEMQPRIVLWWPPYRFGEFVLGVCAAVALRRGMLPRVPALGAASACALAYSICATAAPSMSANAANLIMLAPFLALIVASAQSDLGGDARFQSPTLRFLGESSFALYLVHFPVVAVAGRMVQGQDNVTQLAAAGVAVTAAVLAATVSHVLIERPLVRRLRGKAAGRSTSARVAATT